MRASINFVMRFKSHQSVRVECHIYINVVHAIVDAVVGFEQNYTVMESTGMQEICVNVSQPDSTKTLPFEIPILIVISNSGS